MDIVTFLIMIPLFFIAGVWGRHYLTAPPTHRTNKHIKRDYFDAFPCQTPEHQHLPDDDTHSVILESVERLWWRADVYKLNDDPLSSFIALSPLIIISFSLMGIHNWITDRNEPAKHLFAWEEKLAPYTLPIYLTLIAICLVWVLTSWLKKRLQLLKAVQTKNYHCQITTPENPRYNTDMILDVIESNAQDFVRLDVRFRDKSYNRYSAPILLKIERRTE